MARARPTRSASRRYWLFKSEPSVFAFEDLWKAPGRTALWDGVRNHQARNLLRDEVAQGDGVLFHHSSADPSGIAGVAEVVGEAVPDPTQFDPRSPGHDPRARRADPTWLAVTVRAVARAPRVLTLKELRGIPGLAGMALLRRGQRLSIQPVTASEWATIQALLEPPAPRDGEGEAAGTPRSKRS